LSVDYITLAFRYENVLVWYASILWQFVKGLVCTVMQWS